MAAHSSILALENPMDRGAWRARVPSVAQSWTRLQRLSTRMAASAATAQGLAGTPPHPPPWLLPGDVAICPLVSGLPGGI